MMRVRSFLVFAVLAIMIAWLAVPVQAQASTETITFHDEVMSMTVDPLPCPGLEDTAGTVTSTLNGVMHFSVSAKGTSNIQFTGTGTFVFEPLDPDARSAEGRVTQWFGGQVNVKNGEFTGTFHVTATFTDGTTIHVQGTFHITVVGPDVVVMFEKFICA